jgi:hypothetical protein
MWTFKSGVDLGRVAVDFVQASGGTFDRWLCSNGGARPISAMRGLTHLPSAPAGTHALQQTDFGSRTYAISYPSI